MTGAGWPPRRSPTARAGVRRARLRGHGSGRRLAVPVAATERVLVWHGWPTLGSAYTWALARAEYERWREEVRSQ